MMAAAATTTTSTGGGGRTSQLPGSGGGGGSYYPHRRMGGAAHGFVWPPPRLAAETTTTAASAGGPAGPLPRLRARRQVAPLPVTTRTLRTTASGPKSNEGAGRRQHKSDIIDNRLMAGNDKEGNRQDKEQPTIVH